MLTSAVIAAVISALVALYLRNREDSLKHITAERKAWRDAIRALVDDLTKACFDEATFETEKARIHAAFTVRLNPEDKEDKEILKSIMRVQLNSTGRNVGLKKFSDRVALLLKHDWERAKAEATSGTRVFFQFWFALGLVMFILIIFDLGFHIAKYLPADLYFKSVELLPYLCCFYIITSLLFFMYFFLKITHSPPFLRFINSPLFGEPERITYLKFRAQRIRRFYLFWNMLKP